jgi:hypothetical protein
MPVGPPTMSSAYHVMIESSGDIAIPYEVQFRLANHPVFPQRRLANEQVSDAVGTKATERPPRRQVLAVTTADFPDGSSPSAAMAYPGALMGEVVAVSHFSLSPLERGALGNS